jgi:hypothetical protein
MAQAVSWSKNNRGGRYGRLASRYQRIVYKSGRQPAKTDNKLAEQIAGETDGWMIEQIIPVSRVLVESPAIALFLYQAMSSQLQPSF